MTWYSWFSLKDSVSAQNWHSLHFKQFLQLRGMSVPSASADKKSEG
jgi:hypothetical protein